MNRPWIGITTSRSHSESNLPIISVTEAYVQAVLNAGGLPVLLPVGIPASEIDNLRRQLAGLILTGGADVNPTRFNGKPHPRIYGVDDSRDELEISLVKMAVDQRLPFLGICRGHQVINVALGGTLITDIGDHYSKEIRHDCYPNFSRSHIAHTVSIQSGTRLAEFTNGSEMKVNSLHHQAVEQLAPGLKIAATSPDGLVEAFEIPGHPFGLGVQWHPEWLPDSPFHEEIFKALVQAASES